MTLVVDLAVDVGNLELAHVLRDGTHGTVAEQHGGILVDNGNGGVIGFGDVLGEVAVLHIKHAGIASGVARDDGPASNDTDKEDGNDCSGNRRQAMEELGTVLVLDGGHKQGDDGDDRHKDDPEPDFLAMDVDGGVEPPVAARKRNERDNGENDKGALAPRGDGLERIVELFLKALVRAEVRHALIGRALTSLAVRAGLTGLAVAPHRNSEHGAKNAVWVKR